MDTAQGITPFSNISGSTLFQSLVNRPLLSIIICHSHTLTHSDFRTFTHSLTSQQFQVCPSNGSTSFQIKSSNHWLQGHRPCFKIAFIGHYQTFAHFKLRAIFKLLVSLQPQAIFKLWATLQLQATRLFCTINPYLNIQQL